MDLRFSFHTGTLTPYLFGDGGILFNANDLFKMFANPGIGVRYTVSPKLALNFGVGVMVQADEVRDSFVNLKLGLVYKPK
jgi:hypothetical protein